MSIEPADAAKAEKPRVLVVDDDDNLAATLGQMLESHGCQPFIAWSAETAFEVLGGAEPAIALLDIVLPGADGLRVAADIKSRWPDCEIVMITGQSSMETVVEAIHRGAFDYLSKPFRSLDQVWMVVERALEKRAAWKRRQALLEQKPGGAKKTGPSKDTA